MQSQIHTGKILPLVCFIQAVEKNIIDILYGVKGLLGGRGYFVYKHESTRQ